MSYSVYDVAVPVFTRGLKTFDHVLHKAEAYAKEKGIDANAEYVQARLIEDQLPLVFQVQTASKVVREYVIHLTGEEVPKWDNNEKTFADLHARIKATLELLNKVTPEVANKRAESESVEFNAQGYSASLKLKDAVIFQAITNFIFHLTTGYSILRAKGVPVGKLDYLANFLGLSGFD